MEISPVLCVHPCHSHPEITLSQATNKEKGGCRKLDHKKSKKEKKKRKIITANLAIYKWLAMTRTPSAAHDINLQKMGGKTKPHSQFIRYEAWSVWSYGGISCPTE